MKLNKNRDASYKSDSRITVAFSNYIEERLSRERAIWKIFKHDSGYLLGASKLLKDKISVLRAFNTCLTIIILGIISIFYYLIIPKVKNLRIISIIGMWVMIIHNIIVFVDSLFLVRYKKYSVLFIIFSTTETLLWILLFISLIYLEEKSTGRFSLNLISFIINTILFIVKGIFPLSLIRKKCYLGAPRGRGRRRRRVREGDIPLDEEEKDLLYSFSFSFFYIIQGFFVYKIGGNFISNYIPKFLYCLPLLFPILILILFLVSMIFTTCGSSTYNLKEKFFKILKIIGFLLGSAVSCFGIYFVLAEENLENSENKSNWFKAVVIFSILIYYVVVFFWMFIAKRNYKYFMRRAEQE